MVKDDIDRGFEIETSADESDASGKERYWEFERTAGEKPHEDLFDLVPCFITVQNKNYELLRYNREFSETFEPKPGDYCYHAYKRRKEKCIVCPVEKTFKDGKSHWSEESGITKEGEVLYWVVKTSPIKNAKGDIIAAMEMCVDITHRKKLEEKLELSERTYRAIFKNIPNPLFVLDAETFKILDCNEIVKAVYGYSKAELRSKSFLDFFMAKENRQYASMLKTSTVLNQVKHFTKEGRPIFVNVRVSPSEHFGQKVLLVTTSDITERLEMEQQLIQTSKMATLGEMATGVAHELNQPLSVIKTASNFFMRKIQRAEKIEEKSLFSMAEKISSNVDRATKIINHMREFGRKSDMHLEKVQISKILGEAYDVLSQQLKLRGIEVVWEIEENLPIIVADPGRLEQVFINLLINARDAIEAKLASKGEKSENEKIFLRAAAGEKTITLEICDTGGGIPEAITDKIFEPFFTTKKVGKGTGLGLSISYGIIKDCGGTIQVAPDRGEGACFLITFPKPEDA